MVACRKHGTGSFNILVSAKVSEIKEKYKILLQFMIYNFRKLAAPFIIRHLLKSIAVLSSTIEIYFY